MLLTLARYARYFWDNTKKTPEEIRALSEARFRRTLLHAYDHAAFYKEFYHAHGLRREDLRAIPPAELPVVTKDMVRENFRGFAAIPPDSRRAVPVHTSGSTGKACDFLYSRRMMTVMEANFVRLVNRVGSHYVGFGDLPIRNIHISSVGSGYASTQLLLGGLSKWHAENITLNIAEPASEWTRKIAGARPNFLSGYPNAIEQLADLQEAGQIDLHPKKIICGGEGITPRQMEKLVRVFDADVVNYYGCTEGMLLGAGSNAYEGMYLFDDLHYFETDEEGHLLITPLYNEAFPLIRYRMDDIVKGFTRGTASGLLPFTHIDGLAGREIRPMYFRNEAGDREHLPALLLDDIDAEGLLQYQYVQEDETRLTMYCIARTEDEEALRQTIAAQLEAVLARKRMGNLEWEIRFTDHLRVNPKSGKVPFTIAAGEKL